MSKEFIQAPYDIATANDFNVRLFTAGTTHLANALPKSWHGKYIEISADGGVVDWAVSQHSDAEVDRSVAATAAGASAKVGGRLPDGLEFAVQRKLPDAPSATTLYFVRESDTADTVVRISLVDSPGRL